MICCCCRPGSSEPRRLGKRPFKRPVRNQAGKYQQDRPAFLFPTFFCMPKNNKMTPPPPSKIGSAASDLADELEDLQFFPARSSPPTDILIKQHRAASQSSLQSCAASMSQSTSSSSLNSSNSGSVFSDDFTLGSRVAGGSTHNSPNLTKKQQVQSQESHSHSHSHAHAQRRTSHPSNNYNRPTSSKERYVFSK